MPAQLKQLFSVAGGLPVAAREQALQGALAGLPIYGDAGYIALITLLLLVFLPEVPLARGRRVDVAVGH